MTLARPYPTRPAKSNPAREKPWILEKKTIHSNGEIENFVEPLLVQAVCDTPIARYYGVCILIKGYRSATPLGTSKPWMFEVVALYSPLHAFPRRSTKPHSSFLGRDGQFSNGLQTEVASDERKKLGGVKPVVLRQTHSTRRHII